MTYELPCLDNRKSFYNKAFVREENGEKELISYLTTVCRIDSEGGFHRLWSDYSATTMWHVNSFRRLNGMRAISKSEWDEMEVE